LASKDREPSEHARVFVCRTYAAEILFPTVATVPPDQSAKMPAAKDLIPVEMRPCIARAPLESRRQAEIDVEWHEGEHELERVESEVAQHAVSARDQAPFYVPSREITPSWQAEAIDEWAIWDLGIREGFDEHSFPLERGQVPCPQGR